MISTGRVCDARCPALARTERMIAGTGVTLRFCQHHDDEHAPAIAEHNVNVAAARAKEGPKDHPATTTTPNLPADAVR